MSELTTDEVLNLIEKNSGPKGLDLRNRDLSDIDLSRKTILTKLKERGYTKFDLATILKLKAARKLDWADLEKEVCWERPLPFWLSRHTMGVNLTKAQFNYANLMGAQFEGADLREAQLNHATLTRGAQLQDADLREAQLQSADLMGAQLQDADLREAQLQSAYLVNAQLQGADLREANLEGAHLDDHTNLIKAKLQNANLTGARLQGANLEGARLRGAYLYRAQISQARLEKVDWSAGFETGEELAKKFEDAQANYRELKLWYSHIGRYDLVGEFHFREMECDRKVAQAKLLKPGTSLRRRASVGGLWLFRLSCGYGEHWWWTVFWLLLFLLGPAIAYWLFTPLHWWQAFYFSAAFLVTLVSPLEVITAARDVPAWLETVALVQAYLGYFLLALFLVVFVIKMGHR